VHQLHQLAAGSDGDGRLVEVGGKVRDGRHDEIIGPGDADDGTAGMPATGVAVPVKLSSSARANDSSEPVFSET